MNDLIKVVKSLEDNNLLIKRVTPTVQNEIKEQKGSFLSMLLGTLGASLLQNILSAKGEIGTSEGRVINRAGKGVIRAGYGRCLSSAL